MSARLAMVALFSFLLGAFSLLALAMILFPAPSAADCEWVWHDVEPTDKRAVDAATVVATVRYECLVGERREDK